MLPDDPREDPNDPYYIPPELRRETSESKMKTPEATKAPSDVGSAAAESEPAPKAKTNSGDHKPAKAVKKAKPAAKKAAEKAPAKKLAPKVKAKTSENPAAMAKAKAKAATKSVGKADQFGFRDGSLKSQAAAMYATKKGATLAEVKERLGSIQYNLLTELEQKGFKVDRKEEAGTGNRPATRYHLNTKK